MLSLYNRNLIAKVYGNIMVIHLNIHYHTCSQEYFFLQSMLRKNSPVNRNALTNTLFSGRLTLKQNVTTTVTSPSLKCFWKVCVVVVCLYQLCSTKWILLLMSQSLLLLINLWCGQKSNEEWLYHSQIKLMNIT